MEALQHFYEFLETVVAFLLLFQEIGAKCRDVIAHTGFQDFKGITVNISVFCFVTLFSLFLPVVLYFTVLSRMHSGLG